eukprot:scaffold25626_cov137-Cylindrotheca_fusiformis.AAC.2
MMNSSNNGDEFGENPFRSQTTAETDFFSDSPSQFQTSPAPLYPPMQQNQQQQQFHPQGDVFTQVPQAPSSYPPATGPMDNMAPQQQQHSQMQPPVGGGCWATFMRMLDLNTYKRYFDVEAEDIVSRVKSVFLDFYKPEHFRNNVLGSQQTNGLKGPDLYGPYWVTSNMHAYLHHKSSESSDVFEYDINHLLDAGSILSTFSFVLPAVLWITSKCMKIEALSLAEWECLYGYSLVPFIPAVLLCVIPLSILSWILLLIATLVSCSLIARNVSAPLLSTDVGQVKAPPLILAIVGFHIIFFFIFKIYFFTNHKKFQTESI